MTAPVLLGIAHGSRSALSAPVTSQLVDAAAATVGVPGRVAFLDLADPGVDAAVERLAADGVTEAVAVPLLFTEAYHAKQDAPSALAAAAEKHGVQITLAAVIGTGDDVADTVARHATAWSIEDRRGPVVLLSVGSSHTEANASVQDLARRIGERLNREVTAQFATCAPRAVDAITASRGPGVLLPLFTAPGLLLDTAIDAANNNGWAHIPYLGAKLAPLVAERYRAALSS